MREALLTHVPHRLVLVIFLLIPGLALLYVSYLLRAFVRLHSHALMKRVSWHRGFLFLLPSLLPYWNAALALAAVPFLYGMAAFQVERLWILRALGPEGYLKFLEDATQRASPTQAIWSNLLAGGLALLSAIALWLFSRGPADWAYWFAAGLAFYAVANAFARIGAVRRLFQTKSRGSTG